MGKFFWGVFSLGLVISAFTLSAFVILQSNVRYGWAYILLAILGSTIVIFSYCAKCPIKNNCLHVFPGLVARLFPTRKSAPYRNLDYLGVLLPLSLLILLPQFWLWDHPQLMLLFWLFLSLASGIILTRLCSHCGNQNCPLCMRPHG
jgi:hypothetical protein